MHLEVTFRNVKPRDEVRKRADALFAKLERFLDAATEATLEIGAEHGVTRTELTITTFGQVFQASDEDDDLRTSLDRTFHTIELALRRAKEKRVDRRKQGAGRDIDGFVSATGEDDDEVTGAHVA
jgi:ribosomal subunit interface protein